MAKYLARDSADKLQTVGVSFLGHQAASGGEGVADLQESKLVGGVKDQVLCETRHVLAGQAADEVELNWKEGKGF